MTINNDNHKDGEISRLEKLCLELQSQLEMAEIIAEDAASIIEELMQKVADKDTAIMEEVNRTHIEWEQKRYLQILVVKLVNALLKMKEEMIKDLPEFSDN